MVIRETTGLGLTAREAFTGLVDCGLFSERMPPCLTSRGLSQLVPPDMQHLLTEHDPRKLERNLTRRGHDFIRYQAMRDVNVPRAMGIPHPESYIAQCLSIQRHWHTITSHCSKPVSPISRIFIQKIKDDCRVFRMNYKGWWADDVEEADIRAKISARFIVRADIANCFGSMYTHSIPWALHGRATAKQNRKLSLPGNVLDKATQVTRDQQTNGLMVGPHASNIISEIILTDVDYKLVANGYTSIVRHIDDYVFYADSRELAEAFVRDLGMHLRDYELTVNVGKTEIIPMPVASETDWVRRLRMFTISDHNGINVHRIRALLDLALQLSQDSHTSAPLNFAIQMVPPQIEDRSRRLFVYEVMNWALIYPYLAPLLERYVFDKHHFPGIEDAIKEYIGELFELGLQALSPEAIAYALYYALKYDYNLARPEREILRILELEDCVANLLLWKYCSMRGLPNVANQIKAQVDAYKVNVGRESDQHWLLVYELWTENELRANKQPFLADLKKRRFRFCQQPQAGGGWT